SFKNDDDGRFRESSNAIFGLIRLPTTNQKSAYIVFLK
ncbi:unnamed protein product, partial [Rotaria sp. Silwood2]